jgi:L-ribulose-5-phosphate 3-epimerase
MMTRLGLRSSLLAALGDNEWLAVAAEEVAGDPAAIARHFPVAARRCGRAPLTAGWSADEAGRAVLLLSLRLPPAELAGVVQATYRAGDTAERRAVLRTLPWLNVGADCVDLLTDALRTNDSRLVAAALGPYARHLDDAAWRHGVLKCVFMEIPLADVDGLPDRADPELARMLAGLAHERHEAGRTIPADATALLAHLTEGGAPSYRLGDNKVPFLSPEEDFGAHL